MKKRIKYSKSTFTTKPQAKKLIENVIYQNKFKRFYENKFYNSIFSSLKNRDINKIIKNSIIKKGRTITIKESELAKNTFNYIREQQKIIEDRNYHFYKDKTETRKEYWRNKKTFDNILNRYEKTFSPLHNLKKIADNFKSIKKTQEFFANSLEFFDVYDLNKKTFKDYKDIFNGIFKIGKYYEKIKNKNDFDSLFITYQHNLKRNVTFKDISGRFLSEENFERVLATNIENLDKEDILNVANNLDKIDKVIRYLNKIKKQDNIPWARYNLSHLDLSKNWKELKKDIDILQPDNGNINRMENNLMNWTQTNTWSDGEDLIISDIELKPVFFDKIAEYINKGEFGLITTLFPNQEMGYWYAESLKFFRR